MTGVQTCALPISFHWRPCGSAALAAADARPETISQRICRTDGGRAAAGVNAQSAGRCTRLSVMPRASKCLTKPGCSDSGDPHFKLPPKRPRGGFDLVEAGGVAQVK